MKLTLGQKNYDFFKKISHLYLKTNPAYALGIQFDGCLCVSTEDVPDSPSSPGSPKVALLPPVLKKVPSDKERDGQGSPQPSPRTFSREGKIFFVFSAGALSKESHF